MICSGEFGRLHFFNAGNLVSRGEFIHQRRVMKCWVLIYVLSGRLDISKRMLSDRNMSIKEAAFSCGFNDEKYYMRVFRKIEGMTPGQYRSAIGVK